jgi:hypothetical protein
MKYLKIQDISEVGCASIIKESHTAWSVHWKLLISIPRLNELNCLGSLVLLNGGSNASF